MRQIHAAEGNPFLQPLLLIDLLVPWLSNRNLLNLLGFAALYGLEPCNTCILCLPCQCILQVLEPILSKILNSLSRFCHEFLIVKPPVQHKGCLSAKSWSRTVSNGFSLESFRHFALLRCEIASGPIGASEGQRMTAVKSKTANMKINKR